MALWAMRTALRAARRSPLGTAGPPWGPSRPKASEQLLRSWLTTLGVLEAG